MEGHGDVFSVGAGVRPGAMREHVYVSGGDGPRQCEQSQGAGGRQPSGDTTTGADAKVVRHTPQKEANAADNLRDARPCHMKGFRARDLPQPPPRPGGGGYMLSYTFGAVK